MKQIKNLFIIFVVLFLFSCKVEEFTGSDIESWHPDEALRISGRVSNFFTGDSVPGANVQIGNRQTKTDFHGKFILQYLLSEAERRNKPTPVKITASNYYDLQDEILISPQTTYFTFHLKYAAPVIKDMALIYQNTFDYNYVCQAIIVDYQGIGTIQSVKAGFFCRDVPDDSLITYLTLKRTVNSREGQFQTKFTLTAWIPDWYYLEVIDNEGFSTRVTKRVNEGQKFLFEP